MSNLKVYLCGPINGCTDDECKTWREAAKEVFPNAIDPMRRDYRGREAECVAEIVAGDKADIMDCDVVLANCPKPSVGTSMEVYIAWKMRLPVVCVVPDPAKASPWLVFHSHKLATTMEEAIQWILDNE